jgi:hypothetical protein
LIWDDEYEKNILAVEKYLKIFFIFMKSVEMVDKNSKSQNHDDNNSHKNNFFLIFYINVLIL